MMTKKKRKITKIFNGYSLAIMCCLWIILYYGCPSPKHPCFIGERWYVYVLPDKEDSKIKKQLSEVTKDNIEELKDKIALYYEWLRLEYRVIFDNNFKTSQIKFLVFIINMNVKMHGIRLQSISHKQMNYIIYQEI